MFYYQFDQVAAKKGKKYRIFLQNSTKIQYKVQIHSLLLDLILKITQKVRKSWGFSLLQRLSGIKTNNLGAKLEG